MAFLLIFVVVSPWFMLSSPVFGTGATDINGSSLVFNKKEVVEIGFSPQGVLLSNMVKVWFEASNNGSSPTIVSFRDRVECINTSTLTMLYGTPYPETVEFFGNTTIITWDAVRIEAGGSVEYQYTAESRRSIPIIFNESIFVNGKLAYPKQIGKTYTVSANKSDTLTIQFTVKNTEQRLYTGRKTIASPVTCTVTASLSDDYFSDSTSSPEANATSASAGTTLFTWITQLNDSVTLSFSAKVKQASSWGSAPVEPITIQLKPLPETMITQLNDAIKSLRDQIESLNSFKSIPFSKEIIGEGDTGALETKKADLEDQLLLIQNQKKPYDVEVLATTYNYKATPHVEKVAWRAGPEWVIENIAVINLGNASLVVNGLALKASGNQTTLKPKYAFVLVDGNWQMFYGDLAQLGLEFDTRNGTLYLWPRVEVSASESSNVLVDWAGRPIQLVFEYETAPQVSCILDVEGQHPSVKAESAKRETSCSVIQPHVFIENLTFPEYKPPPPSQQKSWLQELLGSVSSPPVLVSGAALILSILILKRRRRKTIAPNEEASIKDEASIKKNIEKSLLNEIDSLKKALEENKGPG